VSDRTLHPTLAVYELIDLLRDGIREVTGIESLDDVRTIQACADAAELPVTWRMSRHGREATLVDVTAGGAA
jgi:hypothetical protein